MGVTEDTFVLDYGEIINYKILYYIANVLRDIQLTTFKNIFKGVYERPKQYKHQLFLNKTYLLYLLYVNILKLNFIFYSLTIIK